MDSAGIALVDEFDVVRELGEVCGEGVEDGLSLRQADMVSGRPLSNVSAWRGESGVGGWRAEARGRASRSLGVGNHGGRGTGELGVEGAGSQAWGSLTVTFCYQLLG